MYNNMSLHTITSYNIMPDPGIHYWGVPWEGGAVDWGTKYYIMY